MWIQKFPPEQTGKIIHHAKHLYRKDSASGGCYGSEGEKPNGSDDILACIGVYSGKQKNVAHLHE